MMSPDEGQESRSSRWRTAYVGQLPQDFLRINVAPTAAAAATEMTRQPCYPGYQYVMPNRLGRLSITCVQARLNRNYGITRMDPYVRIRIGHNIYETQTDANGGKNPRWNRVIQSQLPTGVNKMYVEIFDECSFKLDELIAWCEIKIPDNVMNGETHEEWYPLSGKLGEGMEGAVDIVLSFSNQPLQSYYYPQMATTQVVPSPMVMVPAGRPMPIFVPPQQVPVTGHPVPVQQQPPPPPAPLTEEDFKQFREMFPDVDREVVKSVYEANHGNKDATINCLLRINE